LDKRKRLLVMRTNPKLDLFKRKAAFNWKGLLFMRANSKLALFKRKEACG
jgi:hypothetical protein